MSIQALNSDGLNGYLQLGAGSTASVSLSTARNSVSYGSPARSVFEGLDGSTLNMVRSSITQAAAAAGAVVWSGGVANVVSTQISDSGGLSVRDDSQPGVLNLVNSLVSVSAQNSDIQRLQAFAGGELNITASSILQDALTNAYNLSSDCDDQGTPADQA